MAEGASSRENSRVALHSVNVVAGGAGHGSAPLKTAAGFQHPDLVAVNIRFQRLLIMEAGVASRTEVKTGGPDDLFMAFGLAVALGALNTQRIIFAVAEAGGRTFQAKSGGVTVETLGRYAAAKMHRAILVAGTIDPPPGAGVIGDWQLEQQPLLPIQVRLAAPAGSDYQIERLGLRAAALDARLVEAPIPLFHPEVHPWDLGAHQVAAILKWAGDRLGGRDTRCVGVSSHGERSGGGAVTERAIKSRPGRRSQKQKQNVAPDQNSTRNRSAIRRPLAFSASKSDTTLVN